MELRLSDLESRADRSFNGDTLTWKRIKGNTYRTAYRVKVNGRWYRVRYDYMGFVSVCYIVTKAGRVEITLD